MGGEFRTGVGGVRIRGGPGDGECGGRMLGVIYTITRSRGQLVKSGT